MSELRSECCGAKVAYLGREGTIVLESNSRSDRISVAELNKNYICLKCYNSTEVEEKNKPQDTALYASLRR